MFTHQWQRDASDRLCYEMQDVAAADYPRVVALVVDRFGLQPMSDLVAGPDQLICNYSSGNCSIGLDWDIWTGFFVTAHSPAAEPLVKSIGAFLSEQFG